MAPTLAEEPPYSHASKDTEVPTPTTLRCFNDYIIEAPRTYVDYSSRIVPPISPIALGQGPPSPEDARDSPWTRRYKSWFYREFQSCDATEDSLDEVACRQNIRFASSQSATQAALCNELQLQKPHTRCDHQHDADYTPLHCSKVWYTRTDTEKKISSPHQLSPLEIRQRLDMPGRLQFAWDQDGVSLPVHLPFRGTDLWLRRMPDTSIRHECTNACAESN